MPTIIIPGDPTGKGRPRFVSRGRHVHAMTPEKTASYESLVRLVWSAKVKEPPIPAGVPVVFRVRAEYGIPASTSKKKREQMLSGAIRPTKKPDFDNVEKIVCDALNGLAYHDDAQIVDSGCVKVYSETPRVIVSVERLDSSPEMR